MPRACQAGVGCRRQNRRLLHNRVGSHSIRRALDIGHDRRPPYFCLFDMGRLSCGRSCAAFGGSGRAVPDLSAVAVVGRDRGRAALCLFDHLEPQQRGAQLRAQSLFRFAGAQSRLRPDPVADLGLRADRLSLRSSTPSRRKLGSAGRQGPHTRSVLDLPFRPRRPGREFVALRVLQLRARHRHRARSIPGNAPPARSQMGQVRDRLRHRVLRRAGTARLARRAGHGAVQLSRSFAVGAEWLLRALSRQSRRADGLGRVVLRAALQSAVDEQRLSRRASLPAQAALDQDEGIASPDR